MNKLVWELFEMIKELLPVTEANTKRFTEWAGRFHALEQGIPEAPSTVEAVDEPDEDPHEHGTPTRRRRK